MTTIEKLSERYQRGYYSKFDFYVGLIDILSRTDDPDPAMRGVPRKLLDEIFEMAEQHYESAGKRSDRGPQKNPEKILQWRRRHHQDHSGGNRSDAPEAVRGARPAVKEIEGWFGAILLHEVRRQEALEAIARLEESHMLARAIAQKLRDVVAVQRIEEEVLAQHSRWCHSDGGFRESVGPAQEAARALYGFVPERLIETDESRVENYLRLIDYYKRLISERL